MKSLIYVLIYTILFVLLGFYVNSEIYEFTDKYTSKVDIIETYIKQDDWKTANYELDNYISDFYNEKGIWYKLLDHEYFDNMRLYLDILNDSIYLNDKAVSLEQISRIKITLHNIVESVKFDLNHIL